MAVFSVNQPYLLDSETDVGCMSTRSSQTLKIKGFLKTIHRETPFMANTVEKFTAVYLLCLDTETY